MVRNELSEELRNRLMTKKYSLNISRIPKNTYERFIEIASEEDFCKDYGMTLKYLLDFHDGIVLHGQEHVEARLNALEQEITVLKGKHTSEKDKPVKAVKTMLSGKTVRIGGN